MNIWPPYCSMSSNNASCNCGVENIIRQIRPCPIPPGTYEPLYKMTDEPPCRDYQPKYDFRNNGEIYEIVSVQDVDE